MMYDGPEPPFRATPGEACGLGPCAPVVKVLPQIPANASRMARYPSSRKYGTCSKPNVP